MQLMRFASALVLALTPGLNFTSTSPTTNRRGPGVCADNRTVNATTTSVMAITATLTRVLMDSERRSLAGKG